MCPKNTVKTPEREIEKYAPCETWIEAIVDGSPIPQFVIDRDHKVLFWSEALEKYSGIKSNEVMGTNRHWKAFYPKKGPPSPIYLLTEKKIVSRSCIKENMIDRNSSRVHMKRSTFFLI